MNIVEFALKFKDLASGELGKFGNAARTTFNNASKLTNDLTGHNKVLGSSYDVLQQKIKQVESTIRNSTIPQQIREAKRELASLQRQSDRHIGNTSGNRNSGGGILAMAGLGKFAGAAAIAGVGLMAGQFFGESFNKGLERQQIQTSFNVLTGSTKAGQELSGQLVKYAKDTVLGPEVFKDAQTMMGFGFKSTEVMPNLKMLGDVSMGNSQKLESLTLAFSQTRAAGKLMGQDLLQYISAGFNPMEEISKRTGKSMGQMRKEMEGGNISFSMVQQAFKDATGEGGKFNKMLETIAQTPAGKIQALTGTWNEFKVSAGTAFMPLISMVLDFASSMMPLIEGLIKPLASGIQMAADWMKSLSKESNGLMSYVDVVRNIFIYGILPAGQKLFGFIFEMVGKLVEFISHSQLLKDLFTFIGIIVSNLWGFIGLLVDALKMIFDTIIMPILNGIEAAYRFITGRSQLSIKSTQTMVGGKTVAGATNTDLLQTIAQNTAENTNATKSNEKAISGGGPKNIYITVQKFFDDLNISTINMHAAENDIEKTFMEMFARVVAQGAVSQ